MRLLVLGASGGCGRWLASLAASRGHQVTALVRPSATFEAAPNLHVRRGNPIDPAVLADVIAGQDAVASCIGIRRAAKWPWAPLRSPADLTHRVAVALVPAMRQAGVRRLVAISAGGVGDSDRQLTPFVRWMLSHGTIGVSYADLARMESVLSHSDLDWLAVRPVTLKGGRPTGRAGPVSRFGLFSTIRRGDVAAWMLSALEGPRPFAEHTVLLGTRRARSA
jgi:uncharacterized protein YbjT (DUF2867 family)